MQAALAFRASAQEKPMSVTRWVSMLEEEIARVPESVMLSQLRAADSPASRHSEIGCFEYGFGPPPAYLPPTASPCSEKPRGKGSPGSSAGGTGGFGGSSGSAAHQRKRGLRQIGRQTCPPKPTL